MPKSDSVERNEDRLHHRIRARKNVPVPEAQDGETLTLEKGVTTLVVGSSLDVLAAVKLDDQLRLQARKVGDVRTDGDLTAKAGIHELLAAQTPP